MFTLLLSVSAAAPVKMPPVSVVPENHSHVLAEFDNLDPLLSALRLDSGRLKVELLLLENIFMLQHPDTRRPASSCSVGPVWSFGPEMILLLNGAINKITSAHKISQSQ